MLAARSRDSRLDTRCPDADEVTTYLRSLLAHSAFNASERNRRFLSYVVNETLQGRADRIKAYNIALAAFDRTADFDPLTDPIVRIEASRLRRSLEHYYLTGGKADRIRIDIPKGSYAATFTYRSEVSAEARPNQVADPGEAPAVLPATDDAPRRRGSPVRIVWAMVAALVLILGSLTYGVLKRGDDAARVNEVPGRPSLVIVPFENTGGDASRSFVARGLTYDVGTALTQLSEVAVFGPERDRGSNSPRSDFTSDFTLMGAVQCDQHKMHVAVLLMDSRTGQFLHSWSFQKDLNAKNLMNAQAEVAQQILESVKRNCTRAADISSSRPAHEMSFDCRRPLPVAGGNGV